MKSFVAILSLAVLAAASPVLDTRTPPKSPQDASDACGDNVVSCCNGSSESNSSGLISAIVGPILANGCLGVGLNASKFPRRAARYVVLGWLLMEDSFSLERDHQHWWLVR